MGIPHLITTLESYASHEVLQRQAVVIDGPALAYHVLHLCRLQGASQPSYSLLSQFVIEWLDRLEDQQITIQAIYFDGYLPTGKYSVRMERVMKTTSRLSLLYSSYSMGCPRRHVVPSGALSDDPPRLGQSADKVSQDPSFVVPAIIDAIRGHPRYREKCFMVPGEADAYCASDVAKHGGTILTGDSDLLAHELGNGKVVFFRDIHENASSKLACTIYAPRAIYTKLGLSKSVEACRLGYERLHSPHATLPMLLKACSRPVSDAVGYDQFRQQYVSHEEASIPRLIGGGLLALSALDPRVSELLLQLGRALNTEGVPDKARIFLPSLLENPNQGTSWDASAQVRRLAYTVASRYLDHDRAISVEEYRRVQNIGQKGRKVPLLSSAEANDAALALLDLIHRVRETGISQQHRWILLCVILDIMECNQQGKNSHALITLQQQKGRHPATTGDKIPWDTIHFSAHIQAAMYSLRILSQVLSSTMAQNTGTDELALNLIQILKLLSELPPLTEFPDVCVVADFLAASKGLRILPILSQFIDFEEGPSQEPEQAHRETQERKSGRKRTGESHGANKKPSKKPNNTSGNRGNMFSALSIDI
ncbi:XPG domain-containing domain-containing protein [Trichoderma novae-zelandiae]